MSLEQALHTVTSVLSQQGIPYAVMGDLAVRVYAIPRFTSDVDLTIAIDWDQLLTRFESL